MRSRQTTLFSLSVAAGVAGVVVFWLASDYSLERQSQTQALIDRGHAVLTALEGGMRSHHRMQMWFRSNIDSTLESMSAGPGIRGLAIFHAQGKLLAKGGDFPDGLVPRKEPQWLPQGLLISQPANFASADEPGPPGRGPMFGRDRRPEGGPGLGPGLGPGAGPGGGRGMGPMWMRGMGPPQDTPDELLQGPVQLAALLDDSAWRQALAKARQRFFVSMAITLTAVLMGLALVAAFQRQGRMAAELGLAREREKRLEELTRLGAGLAHETKNPLSVIRGLAQSFLNRPESPAEAARLARQIIDESDRVVGRINAFLNYSRPLSPQIQTVELDKVLQEMAKVFHDEAAAKGVALSAETPPARVLADPDMLRQTVVNLMANALAACQGKDSIEVSLKPDGRGRFSFAVRDTGCGIAPADLPLVAKPYFTRREGGVGLGLSIVDQIAQAQGWRLEIESAPGQGATVRIAGIQEALPA